MFTTDFRQLGRIYYGPFFGLLVTTAYLIRIVPAIIHAVAFPPIRHAFPIVTHEHPTVARIRIG